MESSLNEVIDDDGSLLNQVRRWLVRRRASISSVLACVASNCREVSCLRRLAGPASWRIGVAPVCVPS